MAACGTTNGYHAHKRRGEKPCAPCREAWNAYCRDYRAGNENYQAKAKAYQQTYQQARSRAITQLIANHHAEYKDLLAAEKAAS
jgi:hypothetical protein